MVQSWWVLVTPRPKSWKSGFNGSGMPSGGVRLAPQGCFITPNSLRECLACLGYHTHAFSCRVVSLELIFVRLSPMYSWKHAKISWKTLKFMYFHRVFMDLVNFHIVKYVFTTSISKFSSGHCPDSKSPGKCPKHGRQLPWRVRSDTKTLRRKQNSSMLT